MKIHNGRWFGRLTGVVAIAVITLIPWQAGWAKTWNTNSGDWHTGENWSPAGVPAAGESVTISDGNAVISLTNETAALDSFIMESGKLVFSNWQTRLVATSVTISGGTVTVANAFADADMSNRVWIACGDGFTLTAPGKIDVSNLGYGATNGPGSGMPRVTTSYGGGGGHGGKGAVGYLSGGSAYDSLMEPAAPGSGGGGQPLAGCGGGVVRIEAGGTASVNGVISANGQVAGISHGGGGAGGTICVIAQHFTGNTNGQLQANGGNGGHYNSGDGGGGRIAIRGGTVANPLWVRFSTAPGNRTQVAPYEANLVSLADWGTVYIEDVNLLAGMPQNNQFNKVILQVGNAIQWTVNQLTLTSNSFRLGPDGFQLTVSNNLVIATNAELGLQGSIDCGGSLMLTNNGLLSVYSGPTNDTTSYGSLVDVASNLLICGNNAWLRPHADPVTGGGVLVRVQDLVITHANSGINATGRGFGPGQGPGKGFPSGSGYSGAGGYGGTGGRGVDSLGGPTNGNIYAPLWSGSGGGLRTAGIGLTNGVASGGGLIRIEASGSLFLDGQIIAKGGKNRGASSYGGAGSGGGVLISCRGLNGSATALISAEGGDTGYTRTGSGGGGRIAVWSGPVFPDSVRNSLYAGTLPYRVEVLDGLDTYAGLISVTNGIPPTIQPATNGLPGTVVFLRYVPPPTGTLILAR